MEERSSDFRSSREGYLRCCPRGTLEESLGEEHCGAIPPQNPLHLSASKAQDPARRDPPIFETRGLATEAVVAYTLLQFQRPVKGRKVTVPLTAGLARRVRAVRAVEFGDPSPLDRLAPPLLPASASCTSLDLSFRAKYLRKPGPQAFP